VPGNAPAQRVADDGMVEDDDNGSNGSLGDVPEYEIDEEDEAQDAAADFDAGVAWNDEYGHDGSDPRTAGDRAHVAPDFPPRMNNFQHDLGAATPSQWLFHFLPFDFFVSQCVAATNAQDAALHLTVPLFMNYLCARLIITMHVGKPVATFWSLDSPSLTNSTPYLGELISGHYFQQISQAFRMHIPMPGDPPDRFSEVRGMWAAVNAHWRQCGIIPGSLCCNDESMASFISRYCPGFVNVKRKPKPMGNVLHCGADAVTKILYILILQEGRDRPPHLPDEKFAHLFPDGGKAGPLMMQLCEPLFGTGSIVIHDAGFACIPALVHLKRKGVFASCLLKKKKYWPKFSHGAENEAHMRDAPLGAIDALQGKFGGEDFAIYLMKDSKYTLQLAANYGKNVRKGPDKRRRHDVTNQLHTFKYSDTIADYYHGRHAADDNNHFRQGIASIEEGWQTKQYHQRMFAVALGMCETNSKLAHDFFKGVPAARKLTSVQWRAAIVDDLLRLYPPPIVATQVQRQRRGADLQVALAGHELVTRPHFAGEYVGRGPNTVDGFRKVRKRYQQMACQGLRCSATTRMYCTCDKAIALCHTCYALHLRDAHM
jgi:hypothetical protein